MRRPFLWLLPIVAALLYLLWNGAVRQVCAEAMWPFRRLSGWAGGQVSGRLVAAWRGLCDGPSRLDAATETERLRTLLAESERLAAENAALREALGWKRGEEAGAPGVRLLAAPVISHGGGLGVWPRLTLGVGSLRGVRTGDVVVAPEGVVGRVAEGVTPHTCEVILLSDPTCRVAAEIPGIAKGIVQGDAGEDAGETPEDSLLYEARPLVLRFVDKAAGLPLRRRVVTEGSGGVFPPGLTIGATVARRRDATGLLTEALIAPAVDPTALRVVFIRLRGRGDDA